MNKEDILNKLSTFLDSIIGESSNPNPVAIESETNVVKSVDEMERRALFVVLEPQEVGETTDLHGDWYDEETVQKACHDYNLNCERLGIMHKEIASDSEVVVQESYISPCDFVTEAGDLVKKGSWLMWLHFPDDNMWLDVVSGVYDSVSIECTATAYDI